MTISREDIIREARCELSRRSFWQYCRTMAPDFYKPDRAFLKDFCDTLQGFLGSDDGVLIVNMPPRHGKSYTVSHFVEWVLGVDKTKKIMTGSYNETLSTNFSKNVRNAIMEIKADKERIVYSDIFPKSRIKYGDAAMNMWSLEGAYNSYLATSPKGTATGFGCSLMIIDDIIRSAEDAYNANVLEGHWNWFTNTMLSRLEEGGKIIVVMTRWHSEDLAGRLIEARPDAKVILYKAVQDDGTMLCPEILSRETYDQKTRDMGAEIVEANYQQTPIDIKGRLYTELKTYTELPHDVEGKPIYTAIRNYTDTADTGDDYLCSICYAVYDREAYITDVLYTKDGMEITEPATARMLQENGVNVADIESNNGGRGFARAVERILKEQYRTNHTVIHPFTQTKNKQSRILSNSAWVMQHIYFPTNWRDRWPEFYLAMTKYQKEGRNAHDDAPDAVTGIAEKIGAGSTFSFD